MTNIGVGTKIGDYLITDHLGAGGAGTVFSAKRESTGESVALKVLRAGAEMNEEIHSRFIREISIAQKLDDPNILRYYDCGVEDGVLYYAMEQVSWGSLDEVLRAKGCLTWQEACECGIQICNGLSHLHEAGIIHRDLKPANIFLSDDGRLKLGDFGLAHDRHAHDLSMDGTTVGTAKYLAPEQARGARDLDGRTDLYALGCNLFEYLVGRTPFESENPYQAANFFEMMRRHVEQPSEEVKDLAPACPAELSNLIRQLLAKDREDRPESAAATANQLRQILGQTPAKEDSVSPEASTGPGDDQEATSLTQRLRENASPHREANTGVLIGIAIALCVVVGAAIVAGGGN